MIKAMNSNRVTNSGIILLGFLLALSPVAMGKKQPIEMKPAVVNSTDEELYKDGNIWYSEVSGTPRSMTRLKSGPFSMQPEENARLFLQNRAEFLKLKPDLSDLALESVKHTPGGTYVTFYQTVGGVKVFRGDIVVSMNKRNEIIHLASNYRPGIDVATTAGISESAAFDAARAYTGDPVETEQLLRSSLRVYPGQNGAILAFHVEIESGNPLRYWEVFVDAATGEIVSARDATVYTDGSGLSFDPDPLTTAQVPYGTPGYVDGNDGDTPELNAERFTRTLRDITLSGGVWHLEGPFCTILDFELPTSAPVTSPDPNGFNYTRNQQGFEDVMAYFHIDQSQRWIQSFGYTNIQNTSIEVDPHGFNGADNSHYLSGSNRIAWGEGGVDDAEDTDVLLHEYGHAIQYGTNSGWGGGEMGAMGEGFGDYWASSYSATITTYQHNWVFDWDGHNPFWPGRILNTTKHYPEDIIGQVHSDGEIWSAGLWDSFNDPGMPRDVLDNLVLEHHFMLASGSMMAQAAEALIDADLSLFNGAHAYILVLHLGNRGFIDPDDYGNMLTFGPAFAPAGQTGIEMEVNLANIYSVREISFTLTDVPNYLSVVDFTGTSRSTSLAPAFSDYDTSASFSLVGSSTDIIQPGAGAVAIITFDVDPAAVPGEVVDLLLSDLFIVDPDSNTLVALGVPGAFIVGQKGDVVPDGEVNILDIIKIINVVLGRIQELSGYELWAADINEDGEIDIFDVIAAINISLGRAFTKTTPAGASEASINIPDLRLENGKDGMLELHISNSVAVAGLQIRIEYDPEILSLTDPVATERASGFETYFESGDGVLEFLMLATSGEQLPSGDGKVLNVTATPVSGSVGDSRLSIVDARLGDANAERLILNMSVGSIYVGASVPGSYALHQNFPNPFNPATTITYNLPYASRVNLTIYDLTGREIVRIVDDVLPAGIHEAVWDGVAPGGAEVASGIYLYRMEAVDIGGMGENQRTFSDVRKLILLK